MFSKIIFLNGCSSAGKTTLAKEIMELSNEPWLNFPLSIFWNALSPKYKGFGEKSDEGFQFIHGQDPQGLPINEVKANLYGEKILNSMPKVFKQLAEDGFNLIIEEVVLEEKYLRNYKNALKDYQIYFVNVACELSILEKREISRGDRILGTNRSQFSKMSSLEWKYDLSIDTSQTPPFANAQKILEFLEENKPRTFTKK